MRLVLLGLNRTFYGIETKLLLRVKKWYLTVLIVPFMELKHTKSSVIIKGKSVLIVPFMELKLYCQ